MYNDEEGGATSYNRIYLFYRNNSEVLTTQQTGPLFDGGARLTSFFSL